MVSISCFANDLCSAVKTAILKSKRGARPVIALRTFPFTRRALNQHGQVEMLFPVFLEEGALVGGER